MHSINSHSNRLDVDVDSFVGHDYAFPSNADPEHIANRNAQQFYKSCNNSQIIDIRPELIIAHATSVCL